MQNAARGIVSKRHVVEAHLATAQREWLRVRRVADLLRLGEQAEHALDIGQRLLDLAVDHAEVVERDRELDQERVDHDQVADLQRAGDDAGRGAPQQQREADRDDRGLADVQCGQRLL